MKFVIISQPRSGTSMLVNTLNSVNGINVYGELFTNIHNIGTTPHPQKIQRDMIKRIIDNSFQSYNKTVDEFLTEIYKKGENVGFKLLYPHIKGEIGRDIINFINKNNILKIVLYRKNKFKQYISAQTNKKEGKIVVNPSFVVKRSNELLGEEGTFHRIFCNGRYIKKSYESLTQSKDLKEVDLSWIDEKIGVVPVPLRKYRPNKISDNISNFDELYEYVKNNKPEYIKWMD